MNHRPLPWWPALLSAGLFLALALGWVRARAYSANDISRLAALTALVERGTWAIDGSPFGTPDKIKVGERFFSDKPPLLTALGALVYAPLYHGLGWQAQAQGCAPRADNGWCAAWADPNHADWAYYLITAVLVSLSGAWVVGLTTRAAQHAAWPPGWSMVWGLALGLGTAIWAYSTAFIHHVPAAAMLGTVTYGLWRHAHPTSTGWLGAGAGLALALAFDLVTGVFAVGLGIYALWRDRRGALWLLPGALPVLAVFAGLNWQITGQPWPAYMYTAGYDYAGSLFGASVAGNQPAANSALYLFDMLVGERGWLAFFPISALYGWGALAAWRPPATRALALAVSLATLAYVGYLATSTNNFGGFAFAARWLLTPLPALAVLAVPRWPVSRAWLGVFLVLAVWSMAHGAWAARDVWRPDWPPVRLSLSPLEPQPEARAGVSGFGNIYQVPTTLRAQAPQGFSAFSFDARHAMVIPPTAAWWFVAAATPPHPILSAGLRVGLAGDSALYANLRPSAARWLETFTQPDPAPVFGEELRLLGYQLLPQPNQRLTVALAWEVHITPPAGSARKAFVHVLNAYGQIVAQNDGLAADVTALRPGDWVFQVHDLDMSQAPADYTLTVGIYDYLSGERRVTDTFEPGFTLER